MTVSVIPACVYICHAPAWCLWKQEEDVAFSGTGAAMLFLGMRLRFSASTFNHFAIFPASTKTV